MRKYIQKSQFESNFKLIGTCTVVVMNNARVKAEHAYYNNIYAAAVTHHIVEQQKTLINHAHRFDTSGPKQ